ncbi:MAG: glycosyltransferase [Anaeroplasma sp.]
MINVLYCGNDKVYDGIMTSIISIYKRSKNIDAITFYIFTMDACHLNPNYLPISDKQISFLDQIVKGYNSNSSVKLIDVKKEYDEEFSNCPNEQCYCSPYTLLRLLLDKIPNMPDKILYLDADIMFNGDILSLYNIDIEGYEYAAARDHYGKYLVNRNYINAGVLLLNLKLMRETNILAKAREKLRTKKLIFADQSALIRSTTKKLVLPQKFNDQKFLHKDTVIRHFSRRLFYLPYPHIDNIKQWDIYKVHRIFKYNQFDDIYFDYVYYKRKFWEETNE